MKNPLIRLREMRDFVGNAERIVAEYLLDNPNSVLECNIRELAEKIYVSPATIVRLCKHLGFEGYREFRQAVVYDLALYQNNERIDKNDIDEQTYEHLIKANTIAIIFPFIRSQVSLLTTQPGMMPVIIPPININALISEQN